jgi:peroxiredoxin
MKEQTDFPLPADLPRPVDDGAANGLVGAAMPSVSLPSTSGRMIDLSIPHARRIVIFCYPKTGVPGRPLPDGWDSIPGARGCTPQACGFRDRYQEIIDLKADVFGLSTQTTEYQQEMAIRLHLPYEILSDSEFKLREALGLPTFEVEGTRLLKRLTLVVHEARIEHVFYPVFPSNENAERVADWLRENPILS